MLKNKSIFWVVGSGVAVFGLFVILSLSSGSDSKDTNDVSGAPCIYSEVFHIHPHLQILVNGQEEIIPADIGVEPGCTREIHTHKTDGEIHIEAAKDRGFKFSNFLSVWGKSLQRPDYLLTMTVDGVETTDTSFVLKDKQQIILSYTKTQ